MSLQQLAQAESEDDDSEEEDWSPLAGKYNQLGHRKIAQVLVYTHVQPEKCKKGGF